MNIVMIGTGYVGLTTGIGFASLGHKVACVDKDTSKVSMLDMGEVPFFERGLEGKLRELQSAGKIVFTTQLSHVMSQADVVMVAVQTPMSPNGEADLQYIYAAVDEIAQHIEREVIVVVKSTVPVGTNEQVLQFLREKLTEYKKDDLRSMVQIASVPEFLREGTALSDFLNPDRIVVGSDDEVTAQTIERMHEGITAPVLHMSLASAELIKYASNAFLATKISFINEIANVAEQVGANIQEVARGVGMDKRIGPHFLEAGIGYGGSCFPKDVSALDYLAKTDGYDFKLLRSVIEVNNRQRELFVSKIKNHFGQIKGRKIAVWGLAFKPNTDDIRQSASIEIVRALFALGAQVSVHDPKAMKNAKHVLPEGVEFAPTPIDAASAADALLILTQWEEYKQVSLSTLKDHMAERVVFDGRNFFSKNELESLGFVYHGVGV